MRTSVPTRMDVPALDRQLLQGGFPSAEVTLEYLRVVLDMHVWSGTTHASSVRDHTCQYSPEPHMPLRSVHAGKCGPRPHIPLRFGTSEATFANAVLNDACSCVPRAHITRRSGPRIPTRFVTTHATAVRDRACRCGPGPRITVRSEPHASAVRTTQRDHTCECDP